MAADMIPASATIVAGDAPPPGQVGTAEAMAAAARRAMAQTGARGLAVAVIDRGQVRSVQTFGRRNAKGDPLTADSVMRAAPLTKAVFGWLVVQLADEGKLDLDRQIARMLPKPLPQYGNVHAYGNWGDLADDPRWQFITPRMVLNHATGLGSLADTDTNGKLRIDADPGTRYRYSDEGIMLLQFALEQGLKIDVAEELERRLFAPLKIRRTALEWHADMGDDIADGWTAGGTPMPHHEHSEVRAAGSMDTTPDEMARILSHIVRGAGISGKARANFAFGTLPITTATDGPAGSAALGVIAFKGPQGPGWYMGGHEEAAGSLLVCLDRGSRGVLILSNDACAEETYPALVKVALGHTGVPL